MANPTSKANSESVDFGDMELRAGQISLNGNPVLGAQGANIASYDITWTSNEPTAGSTATIANGSSPSVAESGQAIADLTAKVNALITALENAGILADS